MLLQYNALTPYEPQTGEMQINRLDHHRALELPPSPLNVRMQSLYIHDAG